MYLLLMLAFLYGESVSLPYQYSEQPQGLRVNDVLVEKISETRARITIRGKHSGYDNGRIYYDVVVKNGAEVIGKEDDWMDIISREEFTDTFTMSLDGDLRGARVYISFGELSVR